ncbi:MAG: SocA family protein [Chitinophagaceae bacterium]|nr:SocA family protein [Chitinophagaceae bacterium]
MIYNVQDIANKIILQTDTEKGDIISNLKLQKMLYYMQGYHLAFFGEKLFDSDLEAWTYGPVVPEVYHRFKEHRSYGIAFNPEEYNEIQLKPEQEDVFHQVMTEYGKFSAIKLMEMTHSEAPWKEANDTPDKIINPETMRTFFSKLIDE